MGLKNRIYEDYFKKSRLPEYKKILEIAKENGYKMVGILDFYSMMKENPKLREKQKILINRHDIDTSPKVAREFFNIEKEVYGHEGSATYYFRESTIDKKLISDIEAYGYETGYHYEQLATFEKKHKLKNVERILEHLPEMREQFRKDLVEYRKKTNTASVTVASHGDFVNTKYDLQSVEILKDSQIRKELKIIVEAYDQVIEGDLDKRFADHMLGTNFKADVVGAINNGSNCILILMHPRNWKVDALANTKENMKRLVEGMKYSLK